MLTRTAKVAVALLCAGTIGCATSRSQVTVPTPRTSSDTVVSLTRTAVIRSVKDERVFEQKPSDPSTPSLGFEGASGASAELKARAIGRKRNTFGMALGDVLLDSGQTVEGLVRENLAAALLQAGYRVTSEDSAGSSPLLIDVHIKKFWAWFQPGMMAISLNAQIATDLDLSGSAVPVTISAEAKDRRQFATEKAWLEIVAQALSAYRVEVVSKATAFPSR